MPIARRTATTSTPRLVHVGVVEQHAALGARAGDLLVHAVDAADHRRLAAAGRADDRGDLVGAEIEVDALDLLGVAVERAQLLEARRSGPGLARARTGSPRCAARGSSALSPARRLSACSSAAIGHVSGWLRRMSCKAAPSRDQTGEEVEQQDHGNERQRGAPRAVHDGCGRRGDVVVDLHRQRVHELAQVEAGGLRARRR